MALSNSNISAVSDIVGSINQAMNVLYEDSYTYREVMSNEEFTKLSGGTALGEDAKEKINRAIIGIDELKNDVDSLTNQTKKYLQEQQEYNNRNVA